MDLLEATGIVGPRHPWEQARLSAVAQLVRRAALQSPSVIDVGCGDGFVIRGLRERFAFSRAVGLDVHLTKRLCADLSSPGMDFVSELEEKPENRFELLLLLDVLEHVEEPAEFLGELVRERLDPGGCAILTVPAFQSLYSHHDRELRHFRRYTSRQLVREAEGAGLKVEDAGYFFATLLPLRAFGVVTERLGGGAKGNVGEGDVGVGGWDHGAFVTRSLTAWLRADAIFCLALRRFGIRVPGLSGWALCRKPLS